MCTICTRRLALSIDGEVAAMHGLAQASTWVVFIMGIDSLVIGIFTVARGEVPLAGFISLYRRAHLRRP